MKRIAWIAIGSGLLMQPALADELFFEATGKISTEVTFYAADGQFANQNYRTNLSLSAEPEFYWQWNEQRDSLTFSPFFRKDQRDSERTHADIRELSWVHLAENWELRTGLRKVFWGVTEFQNLVDVINQKDQVEGLDKEHKLGQPMINLSLVKDWGIVDFYLLPGFREQTYAGANGRLRAGLVVSDDATTYQATNREKHIDLAARWSHSLDVYDFGAHWYKGTDRSPQYKAISEHGKPVLSAHYQQIEQVGLDLQATIDSWLWKGELIYQDNPQQNFWASQLGVEYTFYGIQDTATDLGLLFEFGKDQRGKKANNIMQNDIGIGARFALNDTQSTTMLVGAIHDLDYHTTSFSVEAERRIGDDWKASIEARAFSTDNSDDPAAIFDQDDYLKLTLDWYF
ncbi:MAG: hypothetical protein OFPII_02480 [Osedax symbiont Rs1]|nr:MAG: hypothetical protein OFPII_02480 [Osedax symbiont Rs1]